MDGRIGHFNLSHLRFIHFFLYLSYVASTLPPWRNHYAPVDPLFDLIATPLYRIPDAWRRD